MAIIRVKADYPTIQAAVDAAFAGDVILVEDGVYNEQVTVNTSFIKIIGGEQTVLDGQMNLTVGFILNGTSGVEIKSFIIRNFRSDGIDLIGSANANTIKKVRISNVNYDGISLGSSVLNSQLIGISITGANLGIYNASSNLRIEGSEIAFNGNYGIYCTSGPANVVIRHNAIINNYGLGIGFFGSTATIVCNKVIGNNNYGIYVYSNCLISGNEVKKNASHGIVMAISNNNVRENRANSNGGNGIYVGGSNNNYVIGNDASDNKVNGIFITATGNTVIGNKALCNGLYDIARIYANNTVRNNKCRTSLPPELCDCNALQDTGNDSSKIELVSEEDLSWMKL